MVNYDEEALVCDLAETYNIYNYKLLPMRTVATLSVGLRDNSRIKLKLSGTSTDLTNILLATLCDRVASLIYGLGGGKGKAPVSIAEQFYQAPEKESDIKAFDSGAEFDAVWKKLTEGGECNG